jgi:hypothetical protein
MLLLIGAVNKYDLMKETNILSKLYKVCILVLINFIYWKTMRSNISIDILQGDNVHGFELGIVNTIIYFTLNYIYVIIMLLLFLVNHKTKEAVAAHTAMNDTLKDIDAMKNKMGVTSNLHLGNKGRQVSLLLEVGAIIVICSMNHFAHKITHRVLSFSIGVFLVNLYSYLLRSTLDQSFIIFVLSIGDLFANIENLLQIVIQNKGTPPNTYLQALKHINVNDSTRLMIDYTKFLFQLHR